MADFFDKLMEDAKKAAAKAAQSTKEKANIAKNKALDTVDAVKLEIEIKKIQGNLDKEYQMLGQIVYRIEKGSLNEDEQILRASCNRIDKCLEQIEALEQKKRDKKSAEPKKEEEPAEAPQEEKGFSGYEKTEDGYPMMKFCPHCGAGNTLDAASCVNCHKEL